MIHCEGCGNEIVRSYPNKRIKLRTNIIIWEDGRCICKCLKCKAEVELPLDLHLPGGRVVKGEKTKPKGKKT